MLSLFFEYQASLVFGNKVKLCFFLVHVYAYVSASEKVSVEVTRDET